MPKQSFSHVSTWVFDLDNTLYPPEARLFDQIEVRMTDFVMEALGVGQEEANRLRHEYWRDHGTTLAGLMRLHGVEPGPYLDRVHETKAKHVCRLAAATEGIREMHGREIV